MSVENINSNFWPIFGSGNFPVMFLAWFWNQHLQLYQYYRKYVHNLISHLRIGWTEGGQAWSKGREWNRKCSINLLWITTTFLVKENFPLPPPSAVFLPTPPCTFTVSPVSPLSTVSTATTTTSAAIIISLHASRLFLNFQYCSESSISAVGYILIPYQILLAGTPQKNVSVFYLCLGARSVSSEKKYAFILRFAQPNVTIGLVFFGNFSHLLGVPPVWKIAKRPPNCT